MNASFFVTLAHTKQRHQILLKPNLAVKRVAMTRNSTTSIDSANTVALCKHIATIESYGLPFKHWTKLNYHNRTFFVLLFTRLIRISLIFFSSISFLLIFFSLHFSLLLFIWHSIRSFTQKQQHTHKRCGL